VNAPQPPESERAEGTVWFIGDLDDPWVGSLADTLAPGARLTHSPGELPGFDAEPAAGAALRAVVIHRAVLTRSDAERVARLRSWAVRPRVILCFGPHARYIDLERWSGLVDAALPEATAATTLPRHLAGLDREGVGLPRRQGSVTRPRVAVVSTNFELRQALAEGCEAAGYPSAQARELSEAPATGPAVWDVPVLEPGWAEAIGRRAKIGPVVALLGFADRSLVSEAQGHGAAACLELPVDLADLIDVLDRLTTRPRPEPAHGVPPRPASARTRHASRHVAGPGRGA
jgi:hypothetical protein